jgi:curved DNA-binding protein CbpA
MDLPRAKALEARGQWFALLGLSPFADEQQVKRACRDARVKCHPDKTKTPVELSQILNQAADRVSRLLLEPFQLYDKHVVYKTNPIPAWAQQFEAELRCARAARDSTWFERAFAAYSRRIDQVMEEWQERCRKYEEERQRVAKEDAARVKNRRAKVRRFRYQPKSGARDDEVLTEARKARERLRARLQRKRARTDEDKVAAQAADERVAAEVVESNRRRAQARVDFAVGQHIFPKITKRFATAHPEAASKIRELSRLHDLARQGARYRCHDVEHQHQLLARRETLLREAWGIALAVAGAEAATAA